MLKFEIEPSKILFETLEVKKLTQIWKEFLAKKGALSELVIQNFILICICTRNIFNRV